MKLISNKLNNIATESKWKERIDILSKSFHSHINSNFAQMFSYIKILDICEDNITVTINSKNTDTIEKIRKQVIKKFLYLKSVKLWSHRLLNVYTSS